MITPGLIDLHNHLAYNFLPLWSAPRDTPYTSRHQWPGAATYGRDVSNPAQAMGIAAAAAALRYAEVQGGRRRRHGDPGLAAADPGLPGLDGAQHREGDRSPPTATSS